MVTINDIATKLGISKSTVSKALNNATDISEGMRRKILETAVEMGYINKRSHKKNYKICILIKNMDYSTPNQFGHDLILGFKQKAEPEGWTVDIIHVTTQMQMMTPYNVFMMEYGYLSAFILGFSLIDPWMNELRTTHTPTVLLDNYIKNNPHVASVGCDNQEGYELAVRYLVSLGHKKIGLISGPFDSYIMKARYNAYINAMVNYGLEINEDFIGIGYYAGESTQKYVPRLISNGCTAILFSHDVRAISAITECDNRGIKIPADLSIIGFDDLPMTAFTRPPLTTIRQDRLSLGKCAYYAITCLLNDIPVENIQLRVSLIIRSSTGPAPILS